MGSRRPERRSPLLLLLLLLTGAVALDGIASNLALFTDATQPPAVRSLNLRTFELQTVIAYDSDDLAVLGVPRQTADGTNRTLRPAGIALLQGDYYDTLFWADAGAGAILGFRLDGSGLQVVARGLAAPEQLLVDASPTVYLAARGNVLYWGDSTVNAILRCVIDPSVGTAGNCTAGVTEVVRGVPQVAGLALDVENYRLFWSDAVSMRVRAALVDPASGRALVETTLADVVPYVRIPVGLAFERGGGGGAGRLYLFEQATPARLLRIWLSGNGTQPLVRYGLSRPRAIALAPAADFYCYADSGTKRLIVGRLSADSPTLRDAYVFEGPFEPRALVVRSDASLLIDLDGSASAATRSATTAEAQRSGAPSAGGRRGGRSAGACRMATTACATTTAVGAAVAILLVASSSDARRRR